MTLLIVDGSSLLHRAYHALPPLTAPDGRLVNAAYGFLSVLLKALADINPTHVAMTFDRPEPTFRKQLFPAYQAQREEKPDELYAQIPILEDILASLRIPVYAVPGFEADDVIGTITEAVSRARGRAPTKPRVMILTGDRDLLQLVDDRAEVILFRRGMTETARYDPAAVEERFGCSPERIPDFKALAGDSSDNYPGVPGVGEKTATMLVRAFGGIEAILRAARAERRSAALSEKLAEKLRAHAEDARLGLRLATIVRDVPVAFHLADCARGTYDRGAAVEQLRTLGFQSLLARLPESHEALGIKGKEPMDRVGSSSVVEVPVGRAIRAALVDARTTGVLALAVIADEDDPWRGHPRALGIAFDHRAVGIAPWGTALHESAALLRDLDVAKDAHDAKSLLHALHRSRLDLTGLRYDTELLSYLLAPGTRSHDLGHVAFAELGVEWGSDALASESAADRAGREAALVASLAPILWRKVGAEHLDRIYEEFERPLTPILQRMEEVGVRLDTAHLTRLGERMRRALAEVDAEIMRLAGEPFTIDSPQQLRRILFERLGLTARGMRKTAKHGVFSTAASELEKLRGTHPIIPHILEHRELRKLLSTYVEALPALVHPTTSRIHTTYHQTVTATGRLSSSDPNLQNIPVSEPWGPDIRRAFVAEDGWRLLALDYSQFELRIAAALSGDRTLQAAFLAKQDIHAATAAEVFNVAPDTVTKDQRRVAKAINFGILYGMGAGSLAQTAGIARSEAEEHISRYFAAYPELAVWIETTKALARSRGFAETLFGRKRYLPDIASGVPQVRAAAERMAVNMPIQGTQADLLKRAMIRADEWIRSKGQRSNGVRMILTVHDELVFEVREHCVAEATRVLTDILEHVHQLPVPIVVGAKVGSNWGDMERLYE